MSSSNLNINNVVQISIAGLQAGLGQFLINQVALATKETPINSVPAAGFFTYRDSISVGADWGVNSETYQQAVAIFSQRPNPLSGSGQLIVYPMTSMQTLTQAITTLQPLVFFGTMLWGGYNPNNAEVEAAAATMQAMGLFFPVSTYLQSDLTGSGLLAAIFASYGGVFPGFPKGFYYGQGGTYLAARLAMAAYVGRLFSTDFTGQNTTATMQMKDLAGVLPDSTLTQSVLNTIEGIGSDCFGSIGGLPKVFSNGGTAGNYSDNLYNLEWYTFALEVALFNVIATTSTKIPQTEPGMNLLKAAVNGVNRQAVQNGFLAPGSWNLPDTFGDPATFDSNIEQFGFYVWSAPVSQQTEADRIARKAPLIQDAIKIAGAVHSSSVLVYINE